jgi:outer membrane receptor protein involved in Fe transport
MRLDYFDVDSIGSQYQINPKLGLIYKPWSGAALRGSIGRGFRAPSIAEAFTSTVAGGLRVIPNLDLKPERSFSYEVGVNQIISANAVIDIALFESRFWDLIEGRFTESVNIQFRNVTKASIKGFEINLNCNIIQNLLNINLGYTFTDPVILAQADSINLPSNRYLPYRPRHLFYTHSGINYKNFNIDVDYRFISRYDKIDEAFALIIADAEERVSAHIVDFRLSAHVYKFLISFQINNLLQYHYVDLIGSIAKTRHFILAIEATF